MTWYVLMLSTCHVHKTMQNQFQPTIDTDVKCSGTGKFLNYCLLPISLCLQWWLLYVHAKLLLNTQMHLLHWHNKTKCPTSFKAIPTWKDVPQQNLEVHDTALGCRYLDEMLNSWPLSSMKRLSVINYPKHIAGCRIWSFILSLKCLCYFLDA